MILFDSEDIVALCVVHKIKSPLKNAPLNRFNRQAKLARMTHYSTTTAKLVFDRFSLVAEIFLLTSSELYFNFP